MFNTMTIRYKLILVFTVLIALMGSIFTISYYNAGAINDRLNLIVDNKVVQLQSIMQLRYYASQIISYQKRIIVETDEQKMNALARLMDTIFKQANDELEKLQSLSTGEHQQLTQQISLGLANLAKVNEDIIKLTVANTESEATNRILNENYGKLQKANSTLNVLASELVKSGTKEQIAGVSKIRELLFQLFTQEKDMLLYTSDEQQERELEQATAIETQLDSVTTRMDGVLTGQSNVLLDKYISQFAAFYTSHASVVELTRKKTNTKAFMLSNEEGDRIATDLVKAIESFIGLTNNTLAKDRVETDDLYYGTVRFMLLAIIFSIAISVLMALWLLKGIGGSLNIATAALHKIASGDFSADVKIYMQDEIGAMLKELQAMIVKLRNSVDVAKRVSKGDLMIDFKAIDNFGGELDESLEQMVYNLRQVAITIYNGAHNVTAASQQVASAAQQMSQGAQEQASATEEVSSSMEQMAANILQNTDNSRETEKIATKALHDIEASSLSVANTVDAITSIADKIMIIEEIASKTDLLALNASVEAARAGEHGKGFAVVAAEVRKLAERSQRAATEISEISVRTVKQARASKELLSSTLPDINRTALLVQDIAAASIEQSQGADQINKAIQQLSQVTQGNASAAEEMSSNAEELNSQAEELRAAVGYFKIDHKIQTIHQSADRKHTSTNRAKGTPIFQTSSSANATGFDLKLDDTATDQEFTEF
jgi:methyl-accepting chemotaxis protein